VQKILRHFESDRATDLVDRMLNTDLMTRIPDHLLTTVDRMSMAHSLECRSPLLDYRLVEFAASLPGRLKLKGKNLKYILKQVATRYLPHEVVYRDKQGFGFPVGIWLREDLRLFMINLFKESRFAQLGLFNPRYMQQLLDEHLAGRKDHSFRLWILLNLEIWYRLYFEQQSVESMQEHIESIGVMAAS
jgi:asparagine synthase (glutamine-hydrolysing)